VSLQDAWQDLDPLLSSSAVRSPLCHSIQLVDRQQVASYVEQRGAELTPEELNSGTERLLGYLTRLREACELAVSKGYGIFMALWEESTPKAS
jgi:hypothetical protein